MSSLNQYAIAGKGVIKEDSKNPGQYFLKLKGVDVFDGDKKKGLRRRDIKAFLGKWGDDAFMDGKDPNAVLEFTDSKGQEDAIVFEMKGSKYLAKKDVLKVRLAISDNQQLDAEFAQYSEMADGEFTKRFDDAKLDVSNAVFAKDTKVTLNNYTGEDIMLRQIYFAKEGKTVADYLIIAGAGAAGAMVEILELSLVLLADASAGGVATAAGLGLATAAEAVGLGAGVAYSLYIGGAIIVASAAGVALADAMQTNYNTVVHDAIPPITVPAGAWIEITSSDERWGFSNGVADFAYLVTTTPKVDPVTGVKSVGILGSVFVDNPNVGSTYAAISPGKKDVVPVPVSIYELDPIVLSKGASQQTDFDGGYFNTTYNGSSGFGPWGAKEWTVDVHST